MELFFIILKCELDGVKFFFCCEQIIWLDLVKFGLNLKDNYKKLDQVRLKKDK